MNNSQQLFDLIKALSKNEKRNFKLYAQLHSKKGTSSYLQLFDVLDKMKIYDESSIKELFTKKQKAAQFNPMVNYLFDVIVNSLSTYNNKDFTNIKLKRKVSNAFILMKKGLYDKSRKLLIIAKKEAIEIEDFTTLLEIYKLIILDIPDTERLKALEEMDLIIKKIENIHFYNKTLVEMFAFFRGKDQARKKEDLIAMNQLHTTPLLNDEEFALSNSAKQLFHHIKSFYYFFSGDYQQALNHQERRRGYLEASPEFLKINFDTYLRCTNNIITLYSRLKFHKESKSMIDSLFYQLNNRDISNHIDKAKTFEIYILGKSALILETGDYEDIQHFLLDVEKSINKYEKHMSSDLLIIIYMNIALIYFNIKDYKESLKWLNKSLGYQKQSSRVDSVVFIQLMIMIVHYEIGNKELISYMERSSRRYIKNENRLFKTESILLHFFRVIIIKMETKEDSFSAFRQLKEQLIEVFKDPLEAKLLNYFDFISWIDSKIQNRPFLEVVGEKAGLMN